ncbi:phosphopantetheine-binding protein [Amycolatopsis cynarae]|uniref:Phosphopantetheine-binding protein n=1 Tax=Amycolatopsis cynarae TaxID=2995223 RepID=A0ABY7B969_9PSEU|nr:phosphopantetheine-binding protein [Amycolatopsis sp. HUAS 11-8]WAL68899.1 phosphopantetheine-binding protein [Amycolatopsis sp. HUAS 11-8]
MTTHAARDLARAAVHEALRGFASEGELNSLGPEENLREALELDSIDFLSFVDRLAAATGRRIDEDDYPRLATLSSCIDFLTES